MRYLLLGLMIFSSGTYASSTMRCASHLISLDDHASEILRKCGEPAQRYLSRYREVSDYYGYIQEVPVEEWIYGPRNGMYYYLQLENNRLTRIQSKRRQ